MKYFLLFLLFQGACTDSFSQKLPVSFLYELFVRHRSDTAVLKKEWTANGFPHGSYLIGSYAEFIASEVRTGKKVLRDYVSVFLLFAEDQYRFNNRKLYYRTGNRANYASWPGELQALGFSKEHAFQNDTVQAEVFRNRSYTATVAVRLADYKSYYPAHRHWQQGDDPSDTAFVLTIETPPALTAEEVLALYEKRRDTAYLRRHLLSHGFVEHKTTKDSWNMLSYIGEEPSQLYTEQFTVFLENGSNMVCSKTTDSRYYATWLKDIPASGFQLADYQRSLGEETHIFYSQDKEIILKKGGKRGKGDAFSLYVRKRRG
jgi:hypothetical protein